jgi:short-subunit dehydrogenase
VVLVARDEQELLNGRAHLQKDFPEARIFLSVCGITNHEELRMSIEESIAVTGGLDMLINNAGAITVGTFAAMEMIDFEAQMKLHLYAAIDAIQLLVPHFKSRGGGRIVNVCSIGGKAGVPHMSPYDASKFALAGFAQGVSGELALNKIHMTTVFPSVMRTGSPIQAVFKGDHSKEFKLFETLDNMPVLSLSAHKAAMKVLDAAAAGRSEAILGAAGKARVLMGALFPELTHFMMKLAIQRLPDGVSKERRTGADITERTEPTKEEKMYNQKPHFNAEYSMGIKTS